MNGRVRLAVAYGALSALHQAVLPLVQAPINARYTHGADGPVYKVTPAILDALHAQVMGLDIPDEARPAQLTIAQYIESHRQEHLARVAAIESDDTAALAAQLSLSAATPHHATNEGVYAVLQGLRALIDSEDGPDLQ